MEFGRTYRTRLPLRLAVAAATAFWGTMLVVLARAPGMDPKLAAGAGVFSLFFLVFTVVYGRWSITLTRDGIVVETAFRRRPVRYDDILQITVTDGLGGRVYAVVTRRGPVTFTSLFSRHRELFELLLDHADLRPREV
jgi:hypothetical protein